jgi:hypothetical protein
MIRRGPVTPNPPLQRTAIRRFAASAAADLEWLGVRSSCVVG